MREIRRSALIIGFTVFNNGWDPDKIFFPYLILTLFLCYLFPRATAILFRLFVIPVPRNLPGVFALSPPSISICKSLEFTCSLDPLAVWTTEFGGARLGGWGILFGLILTPFLRWLLSSLSPLAFKLARLFFRERSRRLLGLLAGGVW